MAANIKTRNNLPARGPGRPKGTPNKLPTQVKEMILHALDKAHPKGGAAYLTEQAEKNPVAFMTLVGKVLPLQLTGADGGAVLIATVERKIVRPNAGNPDS